MKKATIILSILFGFQLISVGQVTTGKKPLQPSPNSKHLFDNPIYQVSLNTQINTGWKITNKISKKSCFVEFPSLEIDEKVIDFKVSDFKKEGDIRSLRNGGKEVVFTGNISNLSGASLSLRMQLFPDNEVIRLKYEFVDESGFNKLTKKQGRDVVKYFGITLEKPEYIKEIRLSEYYDLIHAPHCTEYMLPENIFNDSLSVMGPILSVSDKSGSLLLAYEHGSSYPERFIEFSFLPGNIINVNAVKGAYYHGQPLNGYQTPWLEFAMVNGETTQPASVYRNFALNYLSENTASRKPYIYYNTWGLQERLWWKNGTMSSKNVMESMNLAYALKDIDKAHEMGIEVFVLDVGWFFKTGDWEVNTERYPDGLKQIKAKLENYGMKLGLWFNPCMAAVSSKMLQRNMQNRTSVDGVFPKPHKIWQSEESVPLCLVSPYWEDFANELVRLVKETGVTYIKWDAVDQSCNAPGHYHGNEANTPKERGEVYSFKQPEYMEKIVNKVTQVCPEAIFDMDITEPGRCVGLQWLSAGKYIIMNNGPYYHLYDVVTKMWDSPTGNPNIFFNPGPARGWIARSTLDYDTWIPSVLYLTHYLPNNPANSRQLNIASLMLGHNGIWGDLQDVSNDDTKYIASLLDSYKLIREDITKATIIRSGIPGGSPEVYEKINPETGKGIVVMFANTPGTYEYFTNHKVDKNLRTTDQTKVKIGKDGRAIIACSFTEPSAQIIFFGNQK